MESLGEKLKTARTEKGLSFDQISRETYFPSLSGSAGSRKLRRFPRRAVCCRLFKKLRRLS